MRPPIPEIDLAQPRGLAAVYVRIIPNVSVRDDYSDNDRGLVMVNGTVLEFYARMFCLVFSVVRKRSRSK